MTAKHTRRLGNEQEWERARGEGGEQLDWAYVASIIKITGTDVIKNGNLPTARNSSATQYYFANYCFANKILAYVSPIALLGGVLVTLGQLMQP